MTFRLTEMEQRTLRSMNSLHQVHEYGLRNMNVVRIRPDGAIQGGDQTITFTLDSSNLAGNIPLNRIEAEVEYEITATGDISNLILTNPWQAVGTANDSSVINSVVGNSAGYLMSPSNGAMDSLCVNKSFSSIEISNGQVQLAKDSRTAEKIEILSRMLSQENLREAGVYADDNYGENIFKAGGGYELASLVDPRARSAQWARGCSPDEILGQNLFYKRNTNQQYIKQQASEFYTSAGTKFDKLAQNALPFPWSTLNRSADGSLVGYEWVDSASAGVGASPWVGAKQVQKVTVKEELLHDIFASKYQSRPTYYGMPTSQLVLTFNLNPQINSLYKSSNVRSNAGNQTAGNRGNITDIQVKIVNMTLNVLTYNHGLLAIVPQPYYVPFYSEKTEVQTVPLRTDVAQSNYTMNTIRYNSMPEYLLFYVQEPTRQTSTWTNSQMALSTNNVSGVRLTIDNDIGGALYSMKIDELKQRTLTNLDDDFANVWALFRKGQNMCTNLRTDAVQPLTWAGVNKLSEPSFREGRAYLEGLWVLKIGKDIRIPANMMAGLNEKVSFTFQYDFNKVDNLSVASANNIVQCQVHTTAFFPSFYKFSPSEGLLRADKIVVSPAEFDAMVRGTNAKIVSGQGARTNDVYYSHDSPLLIGSGFYGGLNLIEVAKKALPWARTALSGLRSLATVTRDITADIDHDVARAVHKGSKFITDAFDMVDPPKRKASKKAGRPKKIRRM